MSKGHELSRAHEDACVTLCVGLVLDGELYVCGQDGLLLYVERFPWKLTYVVSSVLGLLERSACVHSVSWPR